MEEADSRGRGSDKAKTTKNSPQSVIPLSRSDPVSESGRHIIFDTQRGQEETRIQNQPTRFTMLTEPKKRAQRESKKKNGNRTGRSTKTAKRKRKKGIEPARTTSCNHDNQENEAARGDATDLLSLSSSVKPD